MKPESKEWHEWLARFWAEESEKRERRVKEAQEELEAAQKACREHLQAALRS